MHNPTTAITTIPGGTAAALPFTEPTIPDLRLAEALGYERPADIRPLIKRHAQALDAMGVLRTMRKTSGANGGRPTTEYHLSRAQASFIIAKAKTKRADSLAILMAEVFAMFTEEQLAPVDDTAALALQAAEDCERERRRLIHEEEKLGRFTALKTLNRGRKRARPYRKRIASYDDDEVTY